MIYADETVAPVISLRKIPDILPVRSPARKWEHTSPDNTKREPRLTSLASSSIESRADN